ncbi:MAG TPA: hypothetical protein VIG99_16575 [Myxococcaceae bacterium]|jgi:hypothetical protein
MKWLAVVVLVGGLGARWGMVTMDDTSLRDDIIFLDLLTSTRPYVDAAVLVPFIEKAVKDRHYELVPDSLQIDVKEARDGTLKVMGAGLQVQGKGPTRIQDIDIRFDCRRPGTFFVKTTAQYRLHTEAPGNGKANQWPRGPDDPSGATLASDPQSAPSR